MKKITQVLFLLGTFAFVGMTSNVFPMLEERASAGIQVKVLSREEVGKLLRNAKDMFLRMIQPRQYIGLGGTISPKGFRAIVSAISGSRGVVFDDGSILPEDFIDMFMSDQYFGDPLNYIVSLVLIDRLKKCRPDFFVNGYLSKENFYAIFLSTILVAKKWLNNGLYSTVNAFYREVRDWRTQEILELSSFYNGYVSDSMGFGNINIGFLETIEREFLDNIRRDVTDDCVFVSPEGFSVSEDECRVMFEHIKHHEIG